MSRYESTMRIEKSAARPMSVVDLGVARTTYVWSPRLGEGSNAMPISWAAGGGWGAVRNGASG
jgi:hypothetical protein